ncbi:MAG: hypothetical protein U0S12_10590 [Fimbriimonadales bacterium]
MKTTLKIALGIFVAASLVFVTGCGKDQGQTGDVSGVNAEIKKNNVEGEPAPDTILQGAQQVGGGGKK